MKTKEKVKTIADREMEDSEFRRLFEQTWPLFQLEVQLLNALEQRHWTYADLAKVLHTQKSAISRDLKGGGLRSASIARISKMAEALGLKFFPLCIPKKKAKEFAPVIKKLAVA